MYVRFAVTSTRSERPARAPSPPPTSSRRGSSGVRRRSGRCGRRHGSARPRGGGMGRPAARPGRRRRLHEELDRPDRALRGPDPPARQRHGRRSPSVLQARDAGARTGRQGGAGRATARGRHDHPRPMGGPARQGEDGGGRRVRRGLGDGRRPAAAHGAVSRPREGRRARRARRQRLRACALRAPVQAERGDGGAARAAVRAPSRAGCERRAGDPDHRRLRRGDQCPVPEGGSPDRAVDAERRRRGRRADGRRLRRGRRRRGAPLAVPRPSPAEARSGVRPEGLGGPSAAGRRRGERRRPGAIRVRVAHLGRDRERRRRHPADADRRHASDDHHDPAADVERPADRRKALGDRQAALRGGAPGRAVLPADHARARPRRRWLSRPWGRLPGDLLRRSCSVAASTMRGARRRQARTSSTSTSRRSAGGATRCTCSAASAGR